jgi:hypothetical protein
MPPVALADKPSAKTAKTKSLRDAGAAQRASDMSMIYKRFFWRAGAA